MHVGRTSSNKRFNRKYSPLVIHFVQQEKIPVALGHNLVHYVGSPSFRSPRSSLISFSKSLTTGLQVLAGPPPVPEE